jgi:hypothetical protein
MPHPSNRLNTLRALRHQTKVFEVTVKDQDGRRAKLGGAQIFCTVAETPGGPPIFVKTLDDGIEVTDADNGVAVVTFSTVDMDLDLAVYKYDVWVEYPGDPVVRQPVIRTADLEVGAGVTSFPVVGSTP